MRCVQNPGSGWLEIGYKLEKDNDEDNDVTIFPYVAIAFY